MSLQAKGGQFVHKILGVMSNFDRSRVSDTSWGILGRQINVGVWVPIELLQLVFSLQIKSSRFWAHVA